jgi:hypothetical protein
MCERLALVVLEASMSERISLIATTDGPLQFYAAPGLSSHGDARAGWGIRGGAELEWTGEQHDSLVVRYEDKSMAATIKQMVIDRYPTRKALIATIFETRGQSGKVMWYPRTLDELASVQTKEAVPSVGFANLQVLCDIQHVNDIDLLGYAHPLAQLQSIGGAAYLRGYKHPLKASIAGRVYR